MKDTILKIANWFVDHKLIGVLVVIFCISIAYSQYNVEQDVEELGSSVATFETRVNEVDNKLDVINGKLDVIINMGSKNNCKE